MTLRRDVDVRESKNADEVVSARETRPLAIARSLDCSTYGSVWNCKCSYRREAGFAFVEYGRLGNDADCKRSNPDRKKGLKKMKAGFLQKQTSRRDNSRDSVIRVGNDFLVHLFLVTLSGSSLELGRG